MRTWTDKSIWCVKRACRFQGRIPYKAFRYPPIGRVGSRAISFVLLRSIGEYSPDLDRWAQRAPRGNGAHLGKADALATRSPVPPLSLVCSERALPESRGHRRESAMGENCPYLDADRSRIPRTEYPLGRRLRSFAIEAGSHDRRGPNAHQPHSGVTFAHLGLYASVRF